MDDAGRISQKELITHLTAHGFRECRFTPCMFYHPDRPTLRFTTWVDDFLIKSDSRTDDLQFLRSTLSTKYPITFHQHANTYLGMRINLVRHVNNHALDTITIDMPNYVTSALTDLKFTRTSSPKSPITYIPPIYGATSQLEEIDQSAPASPADQAYLRAAVGSFRYYATAIDSTILLTLSRLASAQSSPTENTMHMLNRFLNYISQFPAAQVIFRPSNMQLHIHSDASYLSEPKSRSRFAGLFTLGPITYNGPNLPSNINGPILVTSSIIPTVVAAATEAEYAGLYLNSCDGEMIRQTLDDLGHLQLPTTITFDNTTAGAIANATAKIRRSKAIAMRYHWIQDRVQQGHFVLRWAPGKLNLADFATKAHPIHHFQDMRKHFVHYPTSNPAHDLRREGVLIVPCTHPPHKANPQQENQPFRERFASTTRD